MAIGASGTLAAAVALQQTSFVPPLIEGREFTVPAFMRVPVGHTGLVVPLAVGGEVVAVLYADDVDRSEEQEDAPVWTEEVELLARHAAAGAAATIGLHTVDDPASAGVVTLAPGGRITSFVEKPRGMTGPALANAGVYCLGQRALDCVAALPAPCDFAADVFPRLLAQGELLHGYPLPGLVIDIGTTARYAEAEARWTGEEAV